MREYNHLPASFNDRINAFFFDLGIVALALLINIFMQYPTIYKILITLAVWFLINILPAFFLKGQTLGKKFASIKVVDLNNIDIKVSKNILRSTVIFLFGALSFGIYFVVGLYVSEKTVSKRSIHDYMFQTKVIRTKPFIQLSE